VYCRVNQNLLLVKRKVVWPWPYQLLWPCSTSLLGLMLWTQVIQMPLRNAPACGGSVVPPAHHMHRKNFAQNNLAAAFRNCYSTVDEWRVAAACIAWTHIISQMSMPFWTRLLGGLGPRSLEWVSGAAVSDSKLLSCTVFVSQILSI